MLFAQIVGYILEEFWFVLGTSRIANVAKSDRKPFREITSEKSGSRAVLRERKVPRTIFCIEAAPIGQHPVKEI